MSKEPASRSYGVATGRFWLNVVLIALAHVALIAGLIRWSVAARASPNPESIMWLGNAADLAAGEPKDQASPPAEHVNRAPEPLKSGEPEEEKPAVTTAESEIELPSPTPKPAATAAPTPRPAVMATPHPEPAPKPVRRPTPKKTLVVKASPKPSPKTKPRPTKDGDKSEETNKSALAKNESQSQSGSGKAGSTDKNSSAGGGSSASEFGWYGNMLHDRFYRAWIQPTTNIATGTKISTLVKLRIEKDGRVSKFEIIKPSGNIAADESVRVVAKQVTQVDPPPTGLFKGDHYDVKINFELNTERKTEN
jgi:TonB family protein